MLTMEHAISRRLNRGNTVLKMTTVRKQEASTHARIGGCLTTLE